MDAAVMSFHLSLSPTSSSSLTRFRPVVMPCNDKLALFKSSSILSNVHPPLLWASYRSFSCWLPIINYGWPPLLVHSGDMSIPFHSPFPNRILGYFLPCHYPHLRIAYSIRIFNAQYPTQPSMLLCCCSYVRRFNANVHLPDTRFYERVHQLQRF